MQDLEAALRVEVERPLVPARRRAIHAKPEQLVEPVLPVAGCGGVPFGSTQVAGVEDADSEQPPIALHETPARAETMGLGIGRPGAVVIDPELDPARFVPVAELQEGFAAGADLERAAAPLAAFRHVDARVAADCPAGQSLFAVKGGLHILAVCNG